MTGDQDRQKQSQDSIVVGGRAAITRDQHPAHRASAWRWRQGGLAVAVRGIALALLAGASLVGTVATAPQAHAAHAGANVADTASVLSTSVSVNPANFVGVCTPIMTITLSGIINLGTGYAGENVPYYFTVDGAVEPPPATNPNPYTNGPVGATSLPVTYGYQIPADKGTGAVHTVYFVSMGKQSIPGATFSLTCTTVTNVTLSGGVGRCTINYTGTITIAPSPGGTVTYTWQFVNGSNASSAASYSFAAPADQAMTKVLTWPVLPPICLIGQRVPPGTYGAILVVTFPNMVYSNPVIIHV